MFTLTTAVVRIEERSRHPPPVNESPLAFLTLRTVEEGWVSAVCSPKVPG